MNTARVINQLDMANTAKVVHSFKTPNEWPQERHVLKFDWQNDHPEVYSETRLFGPTKLELVPHKT